MLGNAVRLRARLEAERSARVLKFVNSIGLAASLLALCSFTSSPVSMPLVHQLGASSAWAEGTDASEGTDTSGGSDGSSDAEQADDGKDSRESTDKELDKQDKRKASQAARKKAAKSSKAAKGDTSAAKKEKLLSKEDRAKVKAAKKNLDKAAKPIASFSGLLDRLGSVGKELAKANSKLSKVQKKRDKSVEKETALSQTYLDAQKSLTQLQTEQKRIEQTNVVSLMLHEVEFNDLKDEALSIEAQRVEQQNIIAAEQVKTETHSSKAKTADAKVNTQKRALEKIIAKGNKIACRLEKADSRSRVKDKAATDAVEKLAKKKKGKAKKAAQDVIDKIAKGVEGHDESRDDARAGLCAWYDAVDAVSGVDSALSFGVGQDFSLSKEKFVAKWGKAIDMFYEHFADTAGFTPPLQGQGETMAGCAYDYKIDPRLCAAVSIAESSGGEYCIQPHNAWGWGAADSDPKNLAASWSSWDEAIKAWHEGMATSTSGLATAGTVSGLGQVYCSTPTWAETVAEQLAEISKFA